MNTYSQAQNQIQDNSIYSIYVPRVNAFYNEADIVSIFTFMGFVSRVDLTPINPTQGFAKTFSEPNTRFHSAFIHFKYFHNHQFTNNIINVLESGGDYVWHYTANEYFIIKKNHSPIPHTLMNVSQVVENCRLLENTVAEKVASLEKKIEEQTQTINRLHETVYQLMSYTLCQTTQSEEINSLVNFMEYGKACRTRYLLNSEDDGTDEYEKQYYEKLHGKDYNYKYLTEDQEDQEDQEVAADNDDSTCSSMPSLVSITSDEYDLQKRNEISDDDTRSSTSSPISIPIADRIRNSAELCGNN
jgi:hypothetical protein